MAKRNRTAHARPGAAPRSQRRPISPLGRPYWTLDLTGEPSHHLPATCATLAMGIHALVRVLANSEAFRVLQESCDSTDSSQAPFDAQLTEDLFAALYMLSEQAVQTCTAMLEREGSKQEGQCASFESAR